MFELVAEHVFFIQSFYQTCSAEQSNEGLRVFLKVTVITGQEVLPIQCQQITRIKHIESQILSNRTPALTLCSL